METWLIILIVVLVLLFVVLPSVIFTYAGLMTLKMLQKSDKPIAKMKGMDVSFYHNGPMPNLVEKGLAYMDTLDSEEVYMNSFDNTKLHAYIYKNPKKSNLFFLGMHGFKSGPRHEYAPYIEGYIKMGFNIIVPDERAHFKSDGKFITMGLKERYDIKKWCEYIVENYGEDTKILIQGVSMGGASVCLASSLDLPKQVVGIVSDCAYTSLKDILTYNMSQVAKNVPVKMFMNVINLFLKARIGISMNDEQPLDAVKKAKVPMLFFHGERDQMVPVNFSKELYQACTSDKFLLIEPQANHAETIAYQKEHYFETIKEFFKL